MPNKAEETIELANRHYAVEVGLTDIFILRDTAQAAVRHGEKTASNEDQTIKLLEVNENTVPSGIYPILFGPAPASGIHFPSLIVEVTPEEFRKIQSSELPLPDGWEIGEHIPKPEVASTE